MTTLHPLEAAELRAHAERAAKARQEGVQLLRDRRDGRHYATSASTPGLRYYVTLASCTCPGFLHYGHCKHHSALVMAHLLQNGEMPEPETRRDQPCARMATTAQTPAPESVTNVHTASGTRIGFVKVVGFTTEAWGYGPEGNTLLIDRIHATGIDAENRAADRVHRHYEAGHWTAPEARVYIPRVAA